MFSNSEARCAAETFRRCGGRYGSRGAYESRGRGLGVGEEPGAQKSDGEEWVASFRESELGDGNVYFSVASGECAEQLEE